MALAACMRDALDQASPGGRFSGEVYSELNGESWRAMEWGSALVRLAGHVSEPRLHLPCTHSTPGEGPARDDFPVPARLREQRPGRERGASARGAQRPVSARDDPHLFCRDFRSRAFVHFLSRADEEYEEDFLFVEFLMRHFFLRASPADSQALLTRYAKALQDAEDIRLELCRALLEKDGEAFGQALGSSSQSARTTIHIPSIARELPGAALPLDSWRRISL